MRNISNKSYRENQNTHFMVIIYFFKSRCLWDNVEKYCRGRQGTNANMALARCIVDK